MDVLSALGRSENLQRLSGEHLGNIPQNKRCIYFDKPVSPWDLVYSHVCVKGLLCSIV